MRAKIIGYGVVSAIIIALIVLTIVHGRQDSTAEAPNDQLANSSAPLVGPSTTAVAPISAQPPANGLSTTTLTTSADSNLASVAARNATAGVRGTPSLPILQSLQPIPADIPDQAQLKAKLAQLVHAYFQVTPSDFDANGNDNGQRYARLAAIIPADVLTTIKQSASSGTVLDELYTTYGAGVQGEVDLTKLIATADSSRQVNIISAVKISASAPNGEIFNLTLAQGDWPDSYWEYQNNTWVLTAFKP